MPTATLEIDRASKRYGDTIACQDVSFAVQPGELFGFAGSDGAGKTTTLRIVVGTLAPDAGQVRLDGAPVTRTTRHRIGYLPEERSLYPKMRVLDQLVYLAELHGCTTNEAHRVAEILIARLGLREQRTAYPGQLNLGQAQRVQLAAALVHEPDVLVLDEPFSGLAPTAVAALSEVLRQLATAGMAVLLASNTLDLVEQLCDRVGIIQNGRMVAVGPVGELRAGGRPELLVDAPHATPGWADTVPGVEVLSVHNGVTRLALAAGADDQAVLAAALMTGPVREFTRVAPTLAQVFAEVVR